MKRIALIAAAMSLFAGCDDFQTGGPEAKPLPPVDCRGEECVDSNPITVVLDHREGIEFVRPQQLQLTLFGYDRLVADERATALAYFEQGDILQTPHVLQLSVPSAPHELIDSEHGPVGPNRAGYYFSIGGDDGCGVLAQDFQSSSIEFFEGELPKEVTLYVTDVCR